MISMSRRRPASSTAFSSREKNGLSILVTSTPARRGPDGVNCRAAILSRLPERLSSPAVLSWLTMRCAVTSETPNSSQISRTVIKALPVSPCSPRRISSAIRLTIA